MLYLTINVLHGDELTDHLRMRILICIPFERLQLLSPIDFFSCILYCSIQTLPCTRTMALVVRAEPNGSQALLMFDGAYSDLEEFGWLPFIRKLDGYNPSVARKFSLSFDGY